MSALPFAECLDHARGGDDEAIAAVLGLVEDRLRRYVDARLGPRLRASLRDSDVLQNAYVEMLRSLPDFPGQTEDDFVAWVTRIIENDIRRQNRWFGAAKRTAPERTSARNALARALLDEPKTPSTEVAAVEEQALLVRALAQLSPDHAQVIELAIFQELAHSEIAARMGRTETATRMLLSRARAALSLALERLDSTPGER